MPCLQPFSKPNPNYGKTSGLSFLKDPTSQMISVPCGYCPDCIAVKQMYLVQRVQMESLVNHLFFCTLTYNTDFLPILEVNGHDIRYADIRHLQLMFKRLRNDNAFPRPWRVFYCSELGSKKGRPHFHLLFMLPKYDSDCYLDCINLERSLYKTVLDYWTTNVGSKRNPDYRPLCTFVQKVTPYGIKSNYDLHYVNPATSNGVSDVAFYVLKYMLKYSDRTTKLQQALHLNLDKSEYESVWSIVRPRWDSSLKFGLAPDENGVPNAKIIEYLKSCVKRTPYGAGYPYYFSPDTGDSFPLCPYYRNNGDIYTLYDCMNIEALKPAEDVFIDSQHKLTKFQDYENKVSYSYSRGDSLLFDDLCE